MTSTAIGESIDAYEEIDLQLLEAGEGLDTSVRFDAEAGDWDLPEGNDDLVLVVDEELQSRALARIVLERFGYRVLTTGDGFGALLHLAAHRDDLRLVLCGQGHGAVDPTRLVRHISGSSSVPIVLCADGSDSCKVDAAIHSGNVRAVLPRPHTIEQLLATVKDAIRVWNSRPKNRVEITSPGGEPS